MHVYIYIYIYIYIDKQRKRKFTESSCYKLSNLVEIKIKMCLFLNFPYCFNFCSSFSDKYFPYGITCSRYIQKFVKKFFLSQREFRNFRGYLISATIHEYLLSKRKPGRRIGFSNSRSKRKKKKKKTRTKIEEYFLLSRTGEHVLSWLVFMHVLR